MKRIVLSLLAAATLPASAHYEVLGGRFRFDAPSSWREARRLETDSTSFVAFAVPRPGGDQSGPVVNVMVDVVLSRRHWDLKTFGDARLNQLEAGPGNTRVIDDQSWADDQSRTALAQGVLHGVPYAVWDKFAVRDSIYLDLRTAVPAAFGADSVWEARYSAQLDSLITSCRVGNVRVFLSASTEGH
jgi:hypothetical protein